MFPAKTQRRKGNKIPVSELASWRPFDQAQDMLGASKSPFSRFIVDRKNLRRARRGRRKENVADLSPAVKLNFLSLDGRGMR
jgi:hypothetical protein